MCLIAFALGQSPRWPLLLASNRDEFHHRPTAPLARWRSPGGVPVLAGRDLEAGGTWLGVAGSRLAMLTNVREPLALPGLRSRGELPLAWLESQDDAERFFSRLEPQAFSGFNLVVADLRQGAWHWASNRQPGAGGLVPGWQQRALGPGIYGLSNAFLDTPWPKTLALKAAFGPALAADHPAPQLWRALADATPAPDAQLPQTGVPPDVERHLSSAFVQFPDGRYGTRSSTLVLLERNDAGQTLHLQEKTWPAGTLRQQRLHAPRAAPAFK